MRKFNKVHCASNHHAMAVATLLSGTVTPRESEGFTITLNAHMEADTIRDRLGLLWRGVSLEG